MGRGIVAGSGEDKAHQGTRSGTSAPSVSHPRVNTLSIVSLVLVAVAVWGFFLAREPVPAATVFAVGAGHVALQQIKVRGERGAILAYIGLGISYPIATYDVVKFVDFYFTYFTA